MKYVRDMLSGIGVLIAIYLILSKGDGAINLLNSLMQRATNGIRVLQGRG